MWKKQEIKKVIELRNQGYNSHQISKMLDGRYSAPAVRRKLMREGYPLSDVMDNNYDTQDNADGTQTSSTILEVIKGEELTPEDILKAHHYDPSRWEIISNTSNFWKQKPESTLYQSKIKIRPLKGIDVEAFIKTVVGHKKPYSAVPVKQAESDSYLVIPAFDTHFNGGTLPEYEKSLQRELNIISSKQWKDVELILGGDLAHIDNINSTTAKGTQLETTDLEKTVDEMQRYFETIISEVLKHSNHLQVTYCSGNHDPSVGYLFSRLLQKEYELQFNIDFDVNLAHYKAYKLGNNFIGSTHGDKGRKNYVANFASRFSVMWGQSKNHELFTGHFHSFKEEDLGGMIQRQVSTRKPTDKWTDDLGVVSTKFFQLVEYDENETRAVYYV